MSLLLGEGGGAWSFDGIVGKLRYLPEITTFFAANICFGDFGQTYFPFGICSAGVLYVSGGLRTGGSLQS